MTPRDVTCHLEAAAGGDPKSYPTVVTTPGPSRMRSTSTGLSCVAGGIRALVDWFDKPLIPTTAKIGRLTGVSGKCVKQTCALLDRGEAGTVQQQYVRLSSFAIRERVIEGFVHRALSPLRHCYGECLLLKKGE
jgi:hypothetical protein